MCTPPKPAAKNQLPQAAGPNTANPPRSIKHTPITGTIRTENAPPVIIPAPYSRSHVAGNAGCKPARNNKNVRNAPATRGGASPRATLRAGPENSGRPRRFAFHVQVSSAIAMARSPSPSHTRSHANELSCRAASVAAASAVTPIRTCPHPDTAVNAARSLHCVADESQVVCDVRSHVAPGVPRQRSSRTPKSPEPVRPRIKHTDSIPLRVENCQVLCDAKSNENTAQRDSKNAALRFPFAIIGEKQRCEKQRGSCPPPHASS